MCVEIEKNVFRYLCKIDRIKDYLTNRVTINS